MDVCCTFRVVPMLCRRVARACLISCIRFSEREDGASAERGRFYHGMVGFLVSSTIVSDSAYFVSENYSI